MQTGSWVVLGEWWRKGCSTSLSEGRSVIPHSIIVWGKTKPEGCPASHREDSLLISKILCLFVTTIPKASSEEIKAPKVLDSEEAVGLNSPI